MSRCKNCNQHTNATFCSEDCAMDSHERAHPDPTEFADECQLCDEIIQGDIENHVRCIHGWFTTDCHQCEMAVEKVIDNKGDL